MVLKKSKILSLLILSGCASFLASCTARATTPRTGPAKVPGRIAAAGSDLLKLLPRSTIAVYAFDLKRFMTIDPIAKAIQNAGFKQGWDEFVMASGIDPEKDLNYGGFGMPAPEDPRLPLLPTGDTPLGNIGIVINLRYDKARILSFLKEKNPDAWEGIYSGVSTLWMSPDAGFSTKRVATASPENFDVIAFLDASHIVIGDEKGVKGVIDVYTKKAEPLADNPDMAALVRRVDKSGIAWIAICFPSEYRKKLADSNPMLKFVEGIKGSTLAFDNKDSMFVADIRTLGGTKEQNANLASMLNGFKAMDAGSAAQEPLVGELLNGLDVTSGEDYVRLSLTFSPEMMDRLSKLAAPKAAASAPESQGAGDEWMALNNQATDLHKKGNSERAVEVGKKALELAEKNAGPDHLDTARSLSNLAVIYDALGRHAEAEPLFKRALAIEEKGVGPDDPRVATSLYNLGRHYDVQGQYAEAEPAYERALVIREKALGPDHPRVADILDELAILRYHQGRDAEPLLKRALALREKALGPNHSDVGKSLTNIAAICTFQGRFAEAEPLLKRALAIEEKALGPNHTDVATTLVLLANIYFFQGQSAKAEPLYKRSLTISEKALGPDHPDVSVPLIMLASIYLGRGQYAKAEPLYNRSLTIREKAFGPDHPDVAPVLDALARIYRETKREKGAQGLEARAARIRSIKR